MQPTVIESFLNWYNIPVGFFDAILNIICMFSKGFPPQIFSSSTFNVKFTLNHHILCAPERANQDSNSKCHQTYICLFVWSLMLLNHVFFYKLDSQHPLHFLCKPSIYILLNRMGLQQFDQNDESLTIFVLYIPLNRKFTVGHFKGPKRPYFCFSTLKVFIRSMACSADIVGIETKAEFWFGSVLYIPFK